MIPKMLPALLVAFALAAPASAEAGCYTTSTTGDEMVVVEIDDSLEPYSLGLRYLVSDLCQPECLFSLWQYQETNNIPGLQRGDMVVDDVASCGGSVYADYLWW